MSSMPTKKSAGCVGGPGSDTDVEQNWTMGSSSASSPTIRNFSNCTARFDGSTNKVEDLEAFIDAVNLCRVWNILSDEQAVRGLSRLLDGEAAAWWQSMEAGIVSWSDAVQRLRGKYGTPGHKIIHTLLHSKQTSERADEFIKKVNSLMSKLPYNVSEEMKIDIIYELLDSDIRRRVSRKDINDVAQLIDKARLAEATLVEANNNLPVITWVRHPSRKAIPKPSTRTRTRSSESRPSRPVACENTCALNYRKATDSKQIADQEAVRDVDDPLPIVLIHVLNRKVEALLDTGATHSMAGPRLHSLFLSNGVLFTEDSRLIGLADGSRQLRPVLDCNVNVKLENRMFRTKFMVLPDVPAVTVLGRDFMLNASIVLDIPQKSWSFKNDPEHTYQFCTLKQRSKRVKKVKRTRSMDDASLSLSRAGEDLRLSLAKADVESAGGAGAQF